jgi:hypothetical protein
VALADEGRFVGQRQGGAQALAQHDASLGIEAQDLARAKQRRRQVLALARIRRFRFEQRVDFLEQRLAAAVERRRVERGLNEQPVEPVLGQNRPERRRNRDAPLGVEAVDEVREEEIHGPALPRGRVRP